MRMRTSMGSTPFPIIFISLIFFPTNLLLAKICSIYSAVHLGFIVFSGMAMAESFFSFFFFLFLIYFFSCFNLCSYKLFFAGISILQEAGKYLILLPSAIKIIFLKNTRQVLIAIFIRPVILCVWWMRYSALFILISKM